MVVSVFTSVVMVLQTIDFTKVTIDVLMVEVWNEFCKQDCVKRDEVRRHMDGLGMYRRYENLVSNSDVYVRIGSPYYQLA
jgi:hypothetical protein